VSRSDAEPVGADVVVVGGGIAGVSAAAELGAEGAEVVLLEAEGQLGQHATGRSAALFSETFGNHVVRSLAIASRSHFESPPEGFDRPLLSGRGVLWIAPPGQEDLARTEAAAGRALVPSVACLGGAEVLARCPVLRADAVGAGVWEPDAQDIDVNALITGYRRAATTAGATIATNRSFVRARRDGERWHVETTAAPLTAGVLVDAAGAWADAVARSCGVEPLGLTPLRRTAFLFDIPGHASDPAWPMVADLAGTYYFKPESGRLLGSPADETPSEPCDARPEEIDVALALDRIGVAVGVELRHASRPWAGLRTFAPDRTPVVGVDPGAPGFVWLAGQGGYGIKTGPAMARAAAAAVLGRSDPFLALLSPARLRGSGLGD
jgi:D-arginine dehydrogenase